MDYFAGNSAHVTNAFSLNGPDAGDPEDRITRKRWGKRVLAFYACLLLGGAISISVYQSTTASGGMEQHATLSTDVRYH